MTDWVTYGILVLLLLVVFFLYLMARRAFLEFNEGMDDGQRRRR